MQKIHDKIAECDREAALRGWSDTGFPRLWFSALSRVAGLELARPPQSTCVNLGDGSIPSPVTRDTSPAICELQQQNDELREGRRWVPVGERLPEEGVEVLWWCNSDDQDRGVYVGKRDRSLIVWGSHEWFIDADFTHWQPLPPGPGTKEGGA